jgi:hypothetical protein
MFCQMMYGNNMSANKSSISQAASYQEIGEFWDTHDVRKRSQIISHFGNASASGVRLPKPLS